MEAARLWARGDLQSDEDYEQEQAEQLATLDADLAAWGMCAERSENTDARQPFYLWPENEEAWYLFMACGTQWRSGQNGREGMDYQGVQIVMRDICGIARRDRTQRMREVHLMVVSALNEWAKARSQQA